MIAFRLGPKDGNGRGVIVLGIDELNVEKLQAGLPINFEGSHLDLDVDVAIMYGARLQDVVDQLAHAGLDVPIEVHEVAKQIDSARAGA